MAHREEHDQMISARRSIETALDFASISFTGLEPRAMHGYGPVPDPTAQELAAVSTALKRLMREGIAQLHAAGAAAEEGA